MHAFWMKEAKLGLNVNMGGKKDLMIGSLVASEYTLSYYAKSISAIEQHIVQHMPFHWCILHSSLLIAATCLTH